MADIKKALRTELLNSAIKPAKSAELIAKIGTRLYPNKLPQNPAFPCLVYFQFGRQIKYLLGGTVNQYKDWYQIDCWATTEIEADTIAETIAGEDGILDRFCGSLGNLVIVSGIWIEDKQDNPDEKRPDLSRITIEIRIEY